MARKGGSRKRRRGIGLLRRSGVPGFHMFDRSIAAAVAGPRRRRGKGRRSSTYYVKNRWRRLFG